MAPVSTPDPIGTERLLLRPSTRADAEVFHRLWTERDARVPPWRRLDDDGHPTLAEVAAQIDDDRGLFTIVRRATGDPLGYAGLVGRGHGTEAEPELVYELLRSAHGRGFATEAGAALVAWARGAGYRRLHSGARVWNVASLRVLGKLGFEEIRVDADPLYGDSVVVELRLRPVDDPVPPLGLEPRLKRF